MKNILIIGDSTSSSIGGFSENWVRKLQSNSTWREQIRFIDTCAPGVTAGAALFIFIKKLFALRFSIFMVILSVGNCDRIDRPYIANKTSALKILFFLAKSSIRVKTRKKHNWIKLDFSKWHSVVPSQSKQKIVNFDKNLRFIKHISKILSINLFVIIPRSNLFFPPATVKNNSIFYDLINFRGYNHSGGNLHLPDFTRNNLLRSPDKSTNLASINYSDIEVFELSEKDKIVCSLNNFAVHLFNAQQLDLSLNCLEQLMKYSNSSSEFFAYNLARIHWESGDKSKSYQFFEEALKLDTSSYRVDLAYSNTVDRVFENSSKIRSLNLYDKKFDSFFLDHCHLLPKGQQLIMEAVYEYLLDFIPQGNYKSILTFEPINPEISEGDLRSFNQVFGIESSNEVETLSFQGRAHAIDVVLRHLGKFPLRSKNIELVESIVFYTFTSQNSKLLFADANLTMAQERNRIENLTSQLKIDLPKIDQFNLTPNVGTIWLDEILKNLHNEIELFINTQKSCLYRMRTIMNWYFKESLFFGFNSSSDMLYIRNDIRRWKEALCLAISLSGHQNVSADGRISKYFRIVKNLEELLSTSYKDLNIFGLNTRELTDLELTIDINVKGIWEHSFEK